MDGNRHKESAQRGTSKLVGGRDNNKHRQNELYRIPERLILENFDAVPATEN